MKEQRNEAVTSVNLFLANMTVPCVGGAFSLESKGSYESPNISEKPLGRRA
jgi:hypothetical protein